MSVFPTFKERLLSRLHLLPTPVLDGFASVLFGRVLAVAVRKGFFESLASASLSAEMLAARTGLDAQAARMIAEALVSGQYLRATRKGYALSAESRKWLLRDSPLFLGNLVAYSETLYARWAHLDYALQHGRPERPYYERFSDDDWRLYVMAMRDLARVLMPHVMRRIALPAGSCALLDLGGSHGLYAIGCCRRYPKVRAVVMDFAPALRQADAIVRQEGMMDRVQLVSGDILRDPLPEKQDGILMFNVIHGFGDASNAALVQRAIGALRPEGKLYILDQMTRTRRSRGVAGFLPLMVGLNLLNEIGGRVYTFEQVRSWCGQAATTKEFRLPIPGVTLVECTRGR